MVRPKIPIPLISNLISVRKLPIPLHTTPYISKRGGYCSTNGRGALASVKLSEEASLKDGIMILDRDIELPKADEMHFA